VLTVATCDGLTTVTLAPAIGAFVAVSCTTPVIVPVVAAPTTLAEQVNQAPTKSAQIARTSIELLNASSRDSSVENLSFIHSKTYHVTGSRESFYVPPEPAASAGATIGGLGHTDAEHEWPYSRPG